MNKSPIGVLDSGIGGLSIWKEIVKKLLHESTVYIADSENCPYGIKTEKEIYRLSKRMVKFLIQKKVKLIVIACNTITVVCLDRLRKNFPNIPIIDTVPVVKTASEKTKNGRVGILSTKQTAGSKYQKDLIKKFCKGLRVLNLGTDRLVPLIERGVVSGIKINKILKEELKPFIDFKADVLVLGCSHFPLLKKEIGQVLGKNVQVLDSGGAIARQTKRILKSNNSLSDYEKSVHLLYTTGDPVRFKKVAEALVRTKLKKVEFVDL